MKLLSSLLILSSLANANNIYESQDLEYISKHFENTPYKANTLIGSYSKKEQLVINLKALDCFTYIDYVEALKQSTTEENFKSKLIDIRYKNSQISYKNRNHFFTDWIKNNNFTDITAKLKDSIKVTKYLNKKEEGVYLKDIKIKKRDVYYLPKNKIDSKNIQTGDYLGIYTKLSGLDVSHVGIAIKKDNKLFLRHASLTYKKVVTVALKDYLKNKIGIVILRK
jgi:hypothetical protein